MEQPDQLAEALERFNRKERNLLVRDALGHKDKKLQLSANFCQRVTSALGLEPSLRETAWWSTDYHIAWLAGALAVYLNDTDALASGQKNPKDAKTGRRLVEGNQEDIDLLIASEPHLIMIEAKAYGAWENNQIASKLDRLDLLHRYYQDLQPNRSVHFHLLLASPTKPQKLNYDLPGWLSSHGKLPAEKVIAWMELDLNPGPYVEQVTRCADDRTPSAKGEFWRVDRLSKASE